MVDQSARRRVLVIANETVEAEILHDTIAYTAHATEVVVVAPALNTRLRHWTSDEDAARRLADERLVGCLSALDDAGVHVRGWVETPIRCWPSRTRSRSSRPTSCSSPPTPRSAPTGSPATSWRAPALASRCRSPTSSSRTRGCAWGWPSRPE